MWTSRIPSSVILRQNPSPGESPLVPPSAGTARAPGSELWVLKTASSARLSHPEAWRTVVVSSHDPTHFRNKDFLA
jgi:hypothetical protein